MQAFELEILKLGPSLLITILGRGERRRRHYGGVYIFKQSLFGRGAGEVGELCPSSLSVCFCLPCLGVLLNLTVISV